MQKLNLILQQNSFFIFPWIHFYFVQCISFSSGKEFQSAGNATRGRLYCMQNLFWQTVEKKNFLQLNKVEPLRSYTSQWKQKKTLASTSLPSPWQRFTKLESVLDRSRKLSNFWKGHHSPVKCWSECCISTSIQSNRGGHARQLSRQPDTVVTARKGPILQYR